ncbi:hypothetical protein [Arthrobacter caoxuetaonis]|uniref:Uncharacterized protein n=1 Tax=Arthrobacter caoxuetaonis TaxID=2886935 RepID=A0A9X1MI53_9MICC|nr:hypothetical protein [Arthrobacter caoxuetaonis]MCC3299747.1 hypothetical protein [Arthrobacter caoxuetaonis]USQ59351.1 hypothetical protein NF551_17365 [Arthrobacter caoxuetaonis]
MGIQFEPEFREADVERYAFACGHPNGLTTHTFESHGDAYTALCDVVGLHGHAGSLAVCGDMFCTSGAGSMSVTPVTREETPVLKVSGTNGHRILRAVGLPDDYCGSAPADSVLRGIQAGTEAAAAGVYGNESAYLLERLPELETVARFAQERGLALTWA